jgi:hypothetical protein
MMYISCPLTLKQQLLVYMTTATFVCALLDSTHSVVLSTNLVVLWELYAFYWVLHVDEYFSLFSVVLSTNLVVLLTKHWELYAIYWVLRVDEYFLLFYNHV